LRALYEEAQTLAPERRLEFVLNTCEDDATLRTELMSLVLPRSDDDALEDCATRVDANAGFAETELPPGHVVGRYRIERLIGRGGMGSVYLAQRADREFEQRVAIKVVTEGLLSSRVIARLRGERQILANLNHPNIARLLDGGATHDGTPFLAMEYVEGEPIDRYCATRALSVRQKLQLFLQVCSAVQYAHTQLVIHRDLKPSNILVTPDGVPKLLDFGIAKLLDPNAPTLAVDLTRIHERVMSPEYASPEQVRGDAVGTPSDVYALGVLLYQLLTGRKPHRLAGQSLQELEREILEKTPPSPSAALRTARPGEDEQANRTLAKALQGDLDTIVMTAMHKEIPLRYATVSALADDIARHLDNRPIAARPDHWTYLARKYWRRNRWSVSSVAAALLIVVAMTIVYTWQLMNERDTAERERLTATRVSQFMTEVFRVANPSESRGNTVPVREILDSAVERIDKDLKDQPRVRVKLLQNMAQAYIGIGLWQSAESLLLDSVAQARTSLGSHALELADSLDALAQVQTRTGNFDGARSALEESLEIRRRKGEQPDRATVLTLLALAYNQASRGLFDIALQTLNEAQALATPLFNSDAALMGEVHASFGKVYADSSRYAQAEQSLRTALPLLQGAIEQGLDRHAESALALSVVLLQQNKTAEAAELLKQQIVQFERVFGADHPLVGDTWNALGIAYCESGDYAPCGDAFRNSADIERRQSTEPTLRLMVRQMNLGSAYHDAGRLSDAIEALKQAEQTAISLNGERDTNLLPIYYELAGSLRDAGDVAGAERLLVAAQPILASVAHENDRLKTLVEIERGRVLFAQGKIDDSVRQLQAAVASIAPEETRQQASARLALGKALLAKGECADAIENLRQAHQLREKAMPAQNWFIYEAENALGDALSRCGQLATAQIHLEHSVVQLRKLRARDDFKLAEAERALAAHAQRAQSN
jgi:serine/threonine protein kinase/predicted negative regulator of RcsB-dependent stress response